MKNEARVFDLLSWLLKCNNRKLCSDIVLSNETIRNYSVSNFCPFSEERDCMHDSLASQPSARKERRGLGVETWFTMKRIKSRKPYSPSTRYRNKYALTFLNNGEELGWRQGSGGSFRDYN